MYFKGLVAALSLIDKAHCRPGSDECPRSSNMGASKEIPFSEGYRNEQNPKLSDNQRMFADSEKQNSISRNNIGYSNQEKEGRANRQEIHSKQPYDMVNTMCLEDIRKRDYEREKIINKALDECDKNTKNLLRQYFQEEDNKNRDSLPPRY
ncbi:hypothetical protein ENBRE01_0570 [Enteropsectra breve]|nr:hypothetical protein ENBRE01_0570 [Enteropsectra breve]